MSQREDYSIEQAAELSGYTRARLYQRIDDGSLLARKVPTFVYRISGPVVEMLKAERQAYAERRTSKPIAE